LGAFHCSGCSFSRPEPSVEAGETVLADGVYSYRLSIDGEQEAAILRAKGMYNIYNALAAMTACVFFGVEREELMRNLEEFKPVAGRMEIFDYNNKKVYLNLVKNTAGFSQALAILREESNSIDLLISVNDQEADGRDVSWLWDVDFEALADDNNNLRRIICSGQRGEDVAVRLKYAGLPPEVIEIFPEPTKAVMDTLNGSAAAVYLLTNYTSMRQVHKIVKSVVR
ncbi:MAG: MurT ligase domain-containing protein, partial [Peptococcaceae bacterium]|nr:MurT ligase domain-containing protein [Peptococcaceae bacterium]